MTRRSANFLTDCRFPRLLSLHRSVLGCCLLTALACPLQAFQHPQTITPRSDREGLVPASDRDAEAWLRRAEEAAILGDWKLACDTIMRLVDQYGDRTVSIEEGHHYVAANQHAQETIGRWPAEGIETYRRLFDPEARHLLDTARKSRDIGALRQVARRFPHSSVGPEAVNLLSAWLIDMGAYGEAIDLLEHLLEMPSLSLPTAPVYQKLGIAYVLNAEPQAAQRTLERLRELKPATADDQSRAKQLAEFIERSQHGARLFPEDAGWPVLLGPSGLMGRMPPIDPAVAPDIAQSDELPGAARINAATAERIMKHTGRPPVWQMVSDGKALFATCPEGVIARDLGSFELLWKSVPKRLPRDPRLERHRFLTGQIEVENAERLEEPVTQAFYHEYRGAVSTALGLVFVIEQVSTTGEHFPQKSGEIDPNNYSIGGDEFGEPNSLRAFDAQTGKAVWTKGRSGPVEDSLRYAHFLGPPCAIGKQLVAPLHVGADLQLARISPEGRLLGTILLGTGQPGMFTMNGTLHPTLHEGTLFVPTGAGMLVALSAHDLSLRWQTAYARSQMAITQGSSPRQVGPGGIVLGGLAQLDEWLASPPLIVGSLVVLAPIDSEWLLAFDHRTGEMKWQFPRGDHRYLVGSDGARVFVAGKSIRAVDVETGLAGWSFEPPSHVLLGRPALAGDFILAPTMEGLVRIRAATGEKVTAESERTAAPASAVGATVMKAPPNMLGNLLVVDGSLFSLAAQSLNRFPDIERSRAIANTTLAKNPDDKPSLLRLAEISAIKRNWREAATLLDRADPLPAPASSVQSGNAASELQERIRHHHIQAILNLAAQCKVEEQAALLERAVGAATRVSDQVSAALAMSDLKKEQGNVRGAVEEALRLAAMHGNEPVAAETDLTVTAGVLVGERIESVIRGLPAGDRRPIDEAVAALSGHELEAIKRQPVDSWQVDHLVRISDVLGGASGAAMDSALARYFDREADHGGACFYLRRALDRLTQGKLPPRGSSEELRLATALVAPGPDLPISRPREASKLIHNLREGADGATRELLGKLTRQLPSVLQAERPIPLQVFRDGKELDLIMEDSIAPTFPSDVRSFWDASRPLDPFSAVVPIRLMKQLKGVQAGGTRNIGRFWSTVVNTSLEEDRALPQRPIELIAHPAAFAGDVAVLDAGPQFCSLDLTTGEMLWPPVAIDRNQGPLPEPPVLAIGSLVVMAADPMSLICVPARPGATPVWRRRWPRRLRQMASVGEMLIVVDAETSQVSVVDSETGRLRRQYGLDVKGQSSTPDADNKTETFPPLAIVGHVVCYSMKGGVRGRDAATGQVLWEHPEPAAVVDLRRLDDGHLAVSLPNMILDVIAVDSGSTVRQFTLDGTLMPPLEMALDWYPLSAGGKSSTGRLTLFCKSNGDPPQFFVQSIPLDSAEPTWRHDLGRFASLNSQMVHASPDYVAAVKYQVKDESGRQPDGTSPIEKTMILVFDKVSGRPLIEPVEITSRRIIRRNVESTKLIKDVIVTNERIIAVSPDAYYVLAASDRPRPKRTEIDDDSKETP